MSHPDTTDPATTEETPQAQEALESDDGIGATTDEANTFEPEEPTS
ncbi:MAG: hypothetical protein U0R72_09885 [Nakamurella multipartita]|mgnify:FL=1|jgi:hypothetical protein